MPKIAFITAGRMPKPDLETAYLVSRMPAFDCQALQLNWDAAVDWASFDLVVLRTPWDYVERLAEFLEWIRLVDTVTALRNPADTVAWNAHKRYLNELAAAGVPVVETILLTRSDTPQLAAVLARFSQREVVAKPAVSIGAYGALRGAANEPSMLDHIALQLDQGDVLLQPFLDEIQTSGETSLVYISGKYSHAVRKRLKPGDYRVQDHHGGTVQAHEATLRELDIAQQTVNMAPDATLYAKVDLVEVNGDPVVMELELIEPELFLRFSEAGTNTYLTAVASAASAGRISINK